MPRREVTICLGQIEWEITEGVEKFTLTQCVCEKKE